jgi:hypothetical protein
VLPNDHCDGIGFCAKPIALKQKSFAGRFMFSNLDQFHRSLSRSALLGEPFAGSGTKRCRYGGSYSPTRPR